jgi:hypothetical protein
MLRKKVKRENRLCDLLFIDVISNLITSFIEPNSVEAKRFLLAISTIPSLFIHVMCFGQKFFSEHFMTVYLINQLSSWKTQGYYLGGSLAQIKLKLIIRTPQELLSIRTPPINTYESIEIKELSGKYIMKDYLARKLAEKFHNREVKTLIIPSKGNKSENDLFTKHLVQELLYYRNIVKYRPSYYTTLEALSKGGHKLTEVMTFKFDEIK